MRDNTSITGETETLNHKAIIQGGVITFLIFLLSSLLLVFVGQVLPGAVILPAAFLLAALSITSGSAYAAHRAGQRHVMHGVLAAMVCFNLVFPLVVIFGSQLVAITPGTAVAGILNYSLFGTTGGLAAKYLGRRR